jgi:FkbM family methyltransferase
MDFSRLISAVNPLGYLVRRLNRIDRKLDQRAAFDDALASGLRELFKGFNDGMPGEPVARWADLARRLDGIEARQERMWGHIEFIRTRLNTYVGEGVALAYAVDGMAIYVNAFDIGCPAALLNGGRYEEDNSQVLLSFVRPDTVFLDIGANIGFYTLQIGRRLSKAGKIYAFEPHPELGRLLHLNVANHLIDGMVTIFPVALSDSNGRTELHYPRGHLGGGSIMAPYEVEPWQGRTIESDMRRLDDLLGPDFACDLAKLDVEGHELPVLRGMRRTIINSPDIKILFEKLWTNSAVDPETVAFFAELGFALYGVRQDASLVPLAGEQALAEWSGYVFAARPDTIEGGLNRSRFSIHPADLSIPGGRHPDVPLLRRAADRGGLLFHGPYWFLRRGVWRLKLHGDISGAANFRVQEAAGRPVLDFTMSTGETEHVFTVSRDLLDFEFFVTAASDHAEIGFARLELIQRA